MKTKDLTRETIRKLEDEAVRKALDDPYRLRFHLMPPSGRLNDPNGLSEVDGINHIYFQYTPHDIKKSSTVAWGHYSTPDFIHYQYLGPGILPEMKGEENGAYSGSIAIGPDGPRAYYTGNVKHPGDFDYINNGREQNIIMADEFDGKNFNRKELIMSNVDYPDDLTLHVRDPKVYFKDNAWTMLLGARDKNDLGVILIYKSKDGKSWKLDEKIIGTKEMGYMWECPDLIELNNEEYLIFSPQGIEALDGRFQNKFQSVWIKKDDLKEHRNLNTFNELDHGFDFYAPQTYIDENGRVILIGWMGMEEAPYGYDTINNGWIHALTIPRLLKEEDGQIFQQPLPELEELREQEETYKLNGENFEIDTPKVYEAEIKTTSDTGEIIIKDSCIFKWLNGEAILSFLNNSGSGRTERKAKIGLIKNIRIFVDTSSIEIFINNGRYVFTTRYFPKNPDTLKIKKVTGELKLWRLKGFEILREDGTPLFKKI